jgi:two-component system, cell cycle response regulator CpdR
LAQGTIKPAFRQACRPVPASFRAEINRGLRFGRYTLLWRRAGWAAMAHILLAEDDESLRKFLAAALVRAGHAVTDFGDGGDAFECLKGFTFDLLLTDIVMPGMDGIELAKRAAELNATLKIMFITGFAAVALHPSSGAPKQAKVLSKPFHLREIVAEVERMMAA